MANPVVVSLTGWNELVVTALLAAEEAMMGGLFLAATYVTDLTAYGVFVLMIKDFGQQLKMGLN